MSDLRAVLFDMDGLLVATEEVWFEAETEVMATLGAPWGPDHQAAVVGGPLQRVASYMIDVAGRPDVSSEQVERLLLTSMEARLRAGPIGWLPGAQQLLDEVNRAGVPAGLVSSSYRAIVDAVLDAVGRDHFAVTVSANDVPRTKPYADPYRAAAMRLGVDPAHCVALEDSPTGVASALAAGCVTVAVPSVTAVDGQVDAVVGSLADIDLAWLRDLAAAARPTPS